MSKPQAVNTMARAISLRPVTSFYFMNRALTNKKTLDISHQKKK